MDAIFNWISEFFSNLFSAILGVCLDLLSLFLGIFTEPIKLWMIEQGFTLEIPSEVFNVLDEITYGIGYILPLFALIPIVTFMLTFYGAKIVFSVFSAMTKFIKIG